jgi:hypothetical protein
MSVMRRRKDLHRLCFLTSDVILMLRFVVAVISLGVCVVIMSKMT